MLSASNLLLAVLAIGMVNADCPQQDVFLQSNDDGAKFFSSCNAFNHKITIGANVTEIDLEGLQSVKKGIECVDATEISTIRARKLRSVGDQFLLSGLTLLRLIDTPELDAVEDVVWRTLPALENLDSLSREIKTASSVLIADTRLTSMKGFRNLTEVRSFRVNNNRSLRSAELSLKYVQDILDFNSNGKGLQVEFSNLIWANNITIRDAASATFPNLRAVNSSASFVSDGFSAIEFPQLSYVGGSLSFVGCPLLTKVTANNVTEIGGTFLVANNTKLANIDGFDSLKTVGGSIDMAGRFTNATLPSLEDGDVRGSFNFQTTEQYDCSQEFDKLRENDVVKGEYICADKKDKAESLTADGLSIDGTGSGKSDSAGVRTSINYVLAVGVGFAAYWAW
jgi:hypothetical protein